MHSKITHTFGRPTTHQQNKYYVKNSSAKINSYTFLMLSPHTKKKELKNSRKKYIAIQIQNKHTLDLISFYTHTEDYDPSAVSIKSKLNWCVCLCSVTLLCCKPYHVIKK